MTEDNKELKKAAKEVLDGLDQPQEYKRRLVQLIENATIGNYVDDDVRKVIQLAKISRREN